MTATEANTAIAAENRDAERGAKWSLFPEGFTYCPPVENVCGCGAKHTGYFQACTICQADQSDRRNF